MTFDEAIDSIVKTVSDFRENEIPPVNNKLVVRWLNQFSIDENSKEALLFETDRLLKSYYCSRERATRIIVEYIESFRDYNHTPEDWLREANFLEIQRYGKSQIEIIEMVGEVLFNHYGLDISKCEGSSRFVYVDDCIYSGNRMLNDVTDWIQDSAPHGSSLSIFCLAAHTRGHAYAYNRICESARSKNISILPPYIGIKINNSFRPDSPIEFLWPKYTVVSNDQIYCYYQLIRERIQEERRLPLSRTNIFRPKEIPGKERVFSSPKVRSMVEQVFLQVGVDFVLDRLREKTTSPDLRPLGFDKLESFGFGSLFITYRNIANNCPLAFWWELDGWIPLFRRKTNHKNFWY